MNVIGWVGMVGETQDTHGGGEGPSRWPVPWSLFALDFRSGTAVALFSYYFWPRYAACRILVPQPGIKPVPPATREFPALDIIVSWQFSDATRASHTCWHQEGDSLSTRHKSRHGKETLLCTKKITFWTIHQYHVNLINVRPPLWAWPGWIINWVSVGSPWIRRPPPLAEPAWTPLASLEISLTGE